MSLFDTTSVALERALSGATLRQQALADNLANANVPGYRRTDVDFHGVLRRAMEGGTPALEQASFAPQLDVSAPMRADGGSVDADRESSLMAQNSLESDALSSVMRGRLAVLRSAIGGV